MGPNFFFDFHLLVFSSLFDLGFGQFCRLACSREDICRNIKLPIRTKAPLYTKLTLMDCGIGNTNLLGSSSSGLGYAYFYMKSTDGTTMYFNLGSGIGSGKFQTDY